MDHMQPFSQTDYTYRFASGDTNRLWTTVALKGKQKVRVISPFCQPLVQDGTAGICLVKSEKLFIVP